MNKILTQGFRDKNPLTVETPSDLPLIIKRYFELARDFLKNRNRSISDIDQCLQQINRLFDGEHSQSGDETSAPVAFESLDEALSDHQAETEFESPAGQLHLILSEINTSRFSDPHIRTFEKSEVFAVLALASITEFIQSRIDDNEDHREYLISSFSAEIGESIAFFRLHHEAETPATLTARQPVVRQARKAALKKQESAQEWKDDFIRYYLDEYLTGTHKRASKIDAVRRFIKRTTESPRYKDLLRGQIDPERNLTAHLRKYLKENP